MPITTAYQTKIDHIQILDPDGKLDQKLAKGGLSDEDAVYLYEQMSISRHYDEVAFKLQRSGRMGTYPQNKGQEAGPAGAGLAVLRHAPGSWLVPCYRENIALFINGLPMETGEMMMETARTIGGLGLEGIKIHLLHLLKHTAMVHQYEAGLLRLMERDEYVNVVCDQLEVLPSSMVIHRLTGDGPPDLLIGPMWSVKKFEVLNAIDRELERRGARQGCRAAQLLQPG